MHTDSDERCAMVAAHTYPETRITRANRVSKHDPCDWCGKDSYCLRFESGDTFCRTIGEEYEWTDDFQGGYLHKNAGSTQKPLLFVPFHDHPKADIQTLDSVNRAILAACPLSDEHAKYLNGLDESAKQSNVRYGSLPPMSQQRPIIGALVDQFGYKVPRTIPGFTVKDGDLRLNGEGLLIAIHNVYGQIVAFQVRHGPSDYRWLSSSDAPSSHAPAHVAGTLNSHCVYIVESPKSANIVSDKLNTVVIGTAGHTNYKASLEPLEYFAKNDVVEVVILFDEDAKAETAEKVERSRQALAYEAVQLGYAVRIGRWNHVDGKGPDDFLLRGGKFTLERYCPTLDTIDAENQHLRDQYEKIQSICDATRIIAGNNWKTVNRGTAALTPTSRIVAINTFWEMGRAPGVEYGTRYEQVYRARIAERSGVSQGTVSKEWTFLAKVGIIQRHIEQNGKTDRQVFFRPGTLPPAGAILDEATHRKQARKGECHSCGSIKLVKN